MLLAAPAWLKLKCMAGHWPVQHTLTAPVTGFKPEGMPRLEGARYKYPTSCILLHPIRHAYTSTHLPIPLLSLD